jgi:uncharacterized protein YdhG (YjbR/CyaY superfamily)
MAKRPKTIDAYLSAVSADRRTVLERLRRTICALAPGAQECISYGIPAFRVDGRVVAGFAATRTGCSYYPFSGATLRTLSAKLTGYGQTKSALHFQPTNPLPTALVRRLLRARMAEAKR